MSYLAKKLWKKPIFGFLFFLTNFLVCIQTYGREWVNPKIYFLNFILLNSNSWVAPLVHVNRDEFCLWCVSMSATSTSTTPPSRSECRTMGRSSCSVKEDRVWPYCRSSWGLLVSLPSCSPRCQPPSLSPPPSPAVLCQVNLFNVWKTSLSLSLPLQISVWNVKPCVLVNIKK